MKLPHVAFLSLFLVSACAAQDRMTTSTHTSSRAPELNIGSEYEFIGKDIAGKEFRRMKVFLSNNDAHLYAITGLCLNNQSAKIVQVVQGEKVIGEFECSSFLKRN